MTSANDNGDLPLILRPAHDGDVHFILNSWLKSFKDSPWFQVADKAYWTGHRELILRLIATKETTISCLADDPDTIVGWACTEPNRIHYVYVKKAFRRMGVARTLLAQYGGKATTFTHWTYHCNYLPIPKYWKHDLYQALLSEKEAA